MARPQPSEVDEATWRGWKELMFGRDFDIFHDGLDEERVTGLGGAAREDAIAMLLAGLEHGDEDAAQALAAMRVVTAAPAIRRAMERMSGTALVTAAMAVHALTPDPSLADMIVRVGRSAPWSGGRMDAVIGLRAFQDEASESFLLDAAADPVFIVRLHAAESLLLRWDVRPCSLDGHAGLQGAIGPSNRPSSPERLRAFRQEILRLKPASRT